MTDPGLPDLPDPQDTPPGGDPGSVPEPEPGENDVVKTSDELEGSDAQHDAAAQEDDQQPTEGDGALEDDESATATNAAVIGQAGIGSA